MIFEHSFSTGLEPNEASRLAADFLMGIGFRSPQPTGHGDSGLLEHVRGSFAVALRRGVDDWPQRLLIQVNGKQVEVAVSIVRPSRISTDTNPKARYEQENTAVVRMGFSLLRSLEMLLSARDRERAAGIWREELAARADGQWPQSAAMLWLVVGLVTAAIGLVVALIVIKPH